jgi:hypothetical protein
MTETAILAALLLLALAVGAAIPADGSYAPEHRRG